jgi:hypothetical protein
MQILSFAGITELGKMNFHLTFEEIVPFASIE